MDDNKFSSNTIEESEEKIKGIVVLIGAIVVSIGSIVYGIVCITTKFALNFDIDIFDAQHYAGKAAVLQGLVSITFGLAIAATISFVFRTGADSVTKYNFLSVLGYTLILLVIAAIASIFIF